jgi:hypothetical protein
MVYFCYNGNDDPTVGIQCYITVGKDIVGTCATIHWNALLISSDIRLQCISDLMTLLEHITS